MDKRKRIFHKLDSVDMVISPPPIIAEVVTHIGRDKVKCPLISKSIYDGIVSKGSRKTDNLERLWQHSLETAVVAENAAQISNYNSPDEAFVAGLLHDLGMIFLAQNFPEKCEKIYSLSLDDKSLIDAERGILAADHQEIGRHIAERWNLPESLSEIIGNHHAVDEIELNASSQLGRIVIFADNLSPSNFEYPVGPARESGRIKTLDSAGSKIGLSLNDIKDICCDLPGEVLKNTEFYDQNTGDTFEYLSRVNRKLFDLYLETAGINREEQGLRRKHTQQKGAGDIHESLNNALWTISHYINNATMNISGQCEVMQMLFERDDQEKIRQKMPGALKSVKSSIRKISIIIEELSKLSNLESNNYPGNAGAIDIEKELKKRLDSSQVSI